MSYQIRITADAHREIKALSGYVRSPALKTINALSANPRPPAAKELRGKPGIYRIRVAGKWRIAYRLKEEEKLVVILRVRLKEKIDYDSL
jgi:mRNA-degrading endonuclease RelE of RelBE toxin-antitoxin system